MKTFEISKDSWHYQLVNKFTGYFVYGAGAKDKADICSYTRALLWSFVPLLAIIALICVVGGLPLAAIIWWIFVHSKSVPAFVAVGTLILVAQAFALTMFGIFEGVSRLREWYRAKNPQYVKQPGSIATMYNHWKEKTCVKIKVKEDDEDNDY